MESDPDLQTYGPVMKEKILQLHARFLLLASLADSVEACYDEPSKCETGGKRKEREKRENNPCTLPMMTLSFICSCRNKK